MVHRLVAQAFCEQRLGAEIVRHLDGNILNNHATNLKWGTPAENSADILRHGNNWNLNKTHCSKGHPFSPENTAYYSPRKRTCRQCLRDRIRAWKRKKRLENKNG